VNKKIIGIGLLVCLAFAPAAAGDKTKKIYELIYEDVQVLKKQILELTAQVLKNADDIQAIKSELKSLGDTIRRGQADDTGFRQELKAVPEQYQTLFRKIEQISFDLSRILESLAPPKESAVPAEPGAVKPQDKTAKDVPDEKTVDPKPKPAPPAPGASPQSIYNMAYSDYLKGNFDLAIDGFTMYKDQFPDSPLADNALYWIGECRYSQRKYADAIGIFNELILTYPRGDKVAAAHLKKAMSCAALGKKDEAIAVYRLLISKFPLEEETRIAQQKLKELLEQ
jgi:tol-pal system protein YbgF